MTITTINQNLIIDTAARAGGSDQLPPASKTWQTGSNGQTENIMITNLLGRILFPRRQAWQQAREARAILGATAVALVFAGLIGLVIFWRNGGIR